MEKTKVKKTSDKYLESMLDERYSGTASFNIDNSGFNTTVNIERTQKILNKRLNKIIKLLQ